MLEYLSQGRISSEDLQQLGPTEIKNPPGVFAEIFVVSENPAQHQIL